MSRVTAAGPLMALIPFSLQIVQEAVDTPMSESVGPRKAEPHEAR